MKNFDRPQVAADLLNRETLPKPTELQNLDVLTEREVAGFDGLRVHVAMEKKSERKGDPNKPNEDIVLADPKTGLFGVADGLGGSEDGEVASQLVATDLPRFFEKTLANARAMDVNRVQQLLTQQQLRRSGNNKWAQEKTHGDIASIMKLDPEIARKALALLAATHGVNKKILELGEGKKDKDKAKTTFCGGLVHESPDGAIAIFINVGDSMAIKIKANGEAVPLTEEDSLLNFLISTERIDKETLEEIRNHPDQPLPEHLLKLLGHKPESKKAPPTYKTIKSSMTAALGGDQAEPSLVIRRVRPGEKIVVLTDGGIDMFENKQTNALDLEDIAQTMDEGGLEKVREESSKREAVNKKNDDFAGVVVEILDKNSNVMQKAA